MLMSYKELCQLVINNVVENCPLSLVNGASIDVTLAERVLVEHEDGMLHPRDFAGREPLAMDARHINKKDGYLMKPGEFILASTEQIFNLPDDIAAEYKLKSSMARIGLNHLNAGWADPTWHSSSLTLELVNCSRYHTIRIRPGDRIGQVVFFRCSRVPQSKSYAVMGRYNGDRSVTPIKP